MWSETAPQGLNAAAWLAHRAAIVRDPSVDRYYSFQDLSGSDGHFKNVAGWQDHLDVAVVDPALAESAFTLVEGRWPWKKAVRLDQVPLESRPFTVHEKSFSCETWIRHLGGGMLSGGNSELEGTLVAVGDGVWVGWRLVMLYPCNSIVFEIGRPKPEPPVGVASLSRVPPEVWTHVACTWDGHDLCLYINGLLSGRTAYAGDFYPAKSHSKFRIGYVGNGLGSVRFEMDEYALYNRCLSPQEILQHAWFQYDLKPEILQEFQLAGDALIAGKLPASLTICQTLLRNADLPMEIRSLAKIRAAECLREQAAYDQAALLFSEVAATADLTDTCRRTALHEAIALREGVTVKSYRPQQTSTGTGSAHDFIDHYALCQTCAEYDRTLDAFRHARAEEDAVRWMAKYAPQIHPVLQQSCFECHQSSRAEGGLDLSRFTDGASASLEGDVWKRVAIRVRNGEMPPPDHPRLPKEERDLIHHWANSRPESAFCEELATEENQRQFSGHVFSRRLNGTEYRNSIRDLLGAMLLDSEQPPQDGSGGEGFDTVGDVLFTSTSHLESYLRAARGTIERAMQQDLQHTDIAARRLLIASPNTMVPESILTELQAAQKILETFARHAWRRPVEPPEIAALVSLYEKSRSMTPDFLSAIAQPLQAVLVSPHFLFVVETEPQGAGVQRLTAHQLATRLALFLWSSVPDEELLALADSQKILEEPTLKMQVRRMLADDRSRALGESFGLQWLGLQGQSDRYPDQTLFPEFTPQLADDLREEAIRFVARIFQDDLPLTDFIHSDWILVNQRLAQHYGLELASQDQWQKVTLSDQRRGGVMTLGSVLTASSFGHRTSPVLRGKWIMHQLLGTYVAPPPAGVPALDASHGPNESRTMRKRLEQHRTQTTCAACHQTMDPLGFSLENYDAIGRWRETEHGVLIDASGTLPSGELVNGPEGLKHALINRQDEFSRHFVRKLLGFALGRGLDDFDNCLVDRCVKQLQQNEYRSSVLIEEICRSYAFQYRYFKPTATQP